MDIKEFPWTKERLNQMVGMSHIDYLVVHHTAGNESSAVDIDREHVGIGWTGIGYHYVITPAGAIEKGRPDNKKGAHCIPCNANSLGVVVCGDFTSTVPSPVQMDALVWLLQMLRAKYPGVKIIRHSDMDATACPGKSFPWDELISRLESDIMMEPVKLIVNGKELEGHVVNDTSFAPARALAEMLGCKVSWDGSSNTVTIISPDLYAENQRLRQILKQVAGLATPFVAGA